MSTTAIQSKARAWARQHAKTVHQGMDLEQRVEDALHAWELTKVKFVSSSNSFVFKAELDHHAVVIKVLANKPDKLSKQSEALFLWNRTGTCVGLIEVIHKGSVMLMQAADPGTSLLESSLEPEEKLITAAGIVKEYQQEIPFAKTFETYEELVPLWKSKLSDEASRKLDQLLASDHDMIHGNLGLQHILQTREGWQTISPQPREAPGAAEVDPILCLCLHHDFSNKQLDEWIDVYAFTAFLDKQEVRDWLLIRALLEPTRYAKLLGVI